jgi:GT2 family glycosyltransferase/SAM-dependent methyltransferase
MTDLVSCPVCKADSSFFRRFGEYCLYKCRDCESLFYNPRPLTHSGDETPWESAKWYVERGANLLFYAEVLARAGSCIGMPADRKGSRSVDMMEVGGSYGFLMDMAAVILGWNVCGVDPTPCAQTGARELELSVANSYLEGTRFKEKFDLVLGVQLIEHINKPRELLKNISNLVNEDGFVVMTTPDASVEDLGAEYSPGEHHVLFSQKGLSRLLTDAGLIHHNFFSTSVQTMMGVVASKKPLSDSGAKSLSLDESGNARQMTIQYLTKKTQSASHGGPLGTGLCFRLFELMVNEGRYEEADTHVRDLETLMGFDGRKSSYSFATRLFEKMTSASTPADYVSAGPGCFAPYLFYKGILTLNHKRDRASAAAYFAYSAGLFEHEVRRLSLIQYEPWIEVARRHMKITGGSAHTGFAYADGDIFGEVRQVEAAPFIRRGIIEFCENVQLGRLKEIGVKGDNSFIYSFTCVKDSLSGLAFCLSLMPRGAWDSVELILHLYEEYNPVALRRTSQTIEFGPHSSSQRLTEPFRFEPIRGSSGKNYSLVLSIGKGSKGASLLCSTSKGVSMVAGYRRHDNTRPVIIPYHSDESRRAKRSAAEDCPLVSCLIVTYNSEGYVRYCLNSIAGQDYPNIEIIVIDNHSNDRTAKIIREEFGVVKLFVMEKNLQFCKGNNFGITKCKGDFICVLNADVVLEPGAVSRFVDHMDISPHIGVVGSSIETKGSRTRYADTFLIDGLISNDEKLLEGTRFSSAPCGAGFMIRRSVIDDLGYLFDEGFVSNWEDHDLGLRCWLHGHIVLHIPDLGLYHYGGSAYGLADPGRDALIFRNMLLTYFKNFGKRLFLQAFLKTLKACTNPHRIWGVVRFVGSFWRYIPERAALQSKRKIDDSVLQVVTSGFPALIPEDGTEKGIQP